MEANISESQIKGQIKGQIRILNITKTNGGSTYDTKYN